MEGTPDPNELHFSRLELRHPDAAQVVDFLDSLPCDEPPTPYIEAYLEANPDSTIDAEYMHTLLDAARTQETTVAAVWFFNEQMTDDLIGHFEQAKPIIEREIIQNGRYFPHGVNGLDIWIYKMTLPSDEARREFEHRLHEVFINYLLSDEFEIRDAVERALLEQTQEQAVDAEPPPDDRQLLPAESPPRSSPARRAPTP